jgi:hypothetical protein
MPQKNTKQLSVPVAPSDLSETEQDLLSHLQDGYEMETDTLESDVLLRQPKTKETIRPLSATRNTVKALEERGLIAPAKGNEPLRILWTLTGSKSPKKFMTKSAKAARRTMRQK